jgi:hypothetical protein
MTDTDRVQLFNTLGSIATPLLRVIDEYDFRDSMLSFPFLRHLFDNHETQAKQDLTAEDFHPRRKWQHHSHECTKTRRQERDAQVL